MTGAHGIGLVHLIVQVLDISSNTHCDRNYAVKYTHGKATPVIKELMKAVSLCMEHIRPMLNILYRNLKACMMYSWMW